METVKLTNNEKSVLVAIVANAKQVGDNGVEFILADVAEEMGKNIRSISATAGSLAKKGMLLTANGDSYFDGELTEAGLHEVEESDKVNQEVTNKNQSNMEDKNFDAPVMDERIVKLNELKSVKMAALSKSKRPAAKANKTAAQFVLERWDDEEELKRFISDESMKVECYEVWCIADSRYKQLSYRPEEAPKEDAQPKAKKTASKKETKKADKTEQLKLPAKWVTFTRSTRHGYGRSMHQESLIGVPIRKIRSRVSVPIWRTKRRISSRSPKQPIRRLLRARKQSRKLRRKRRNLFIQLTSGLLYLPNLQAPKAKCRKLRKKRSSSSTGVIG